MFIRLRLGGRLRAELDSLDVLQETFVEAHRAFERFVCRDDDAFARWLCCLAENRIRGLADHHGAKKRRPKGARRPVTAVLEEAQQSQTGPITAAARSEGRAALAEALEGLEEDARELILLRHFQGRSLAEIATLTEGSQSGVRRQIGRAQRALGRALRERGHGGE